MSNLYSYQQYDSDFDIIVNVDLPTMTVKEFKKIKGIKTGSWTHPANQFMIQTYRVEIYDSQKWVELSESDTLDFTICPRLKIQLVRLL